VGSSPIGHPSFAPRKWRTPALGGRPSVRPAVAALFSAALAQVEVNARGVAQSADPEFLHQLRVGLRRLRTVQRAFRDVIPRRSAKPLKRALRELKPALGAARDWDVFLADCALPREMVPVARRKRAAAWRRAHSVLASRAFDEFLRRAWRCMHQIKVSPFKDVHAHALESFYRKALKHARRVDWRDEKRRHALRIRIRRLRYACEFFAPFFARAQCAAYLKRVKALQDLLGELNDIVVARRLLKDLKTATPRQLQRREARLISALGPAWAAFERSRTFWG
jgi:CHAD domain-containing protein